MAVRVVVGEDEPLVREGIVRVLEGADFDVVGVAADATDLIRKTNAHKPDVVVTDIQMPPDRTDDGLRAAIQIRETRPRIGVVVLSQYDDPDYAIADLHASVRPIRLQALELRLGLARSQGHPVHRSFLG